MLQEEKCFPKELSYIDDKSEMFSSWESKNEIYKELYCAEKKIESAVQFRKYIQFILQFRNRKKRS